MSSPASDDGLWRDVPQAAVQPAGARSSWGGAARAANQQPQQQGLPAPAVCTAPPPPQTCPRPVPLRSAVPTVAPPRPAPARRASSGTPPAFRVGGTMEWLRHPAVPHTLLNFVSYSCWTLWNKHLFTKASVDETRPPLPLLSTALQMLVVAGVCVLLLFAGAGPQEAPSKTALRRRLLPLAVVRSADLAFANAALCLMSVAAQQILKSTIPVWVALFSITVLRRPVPGPAWLVVAIIVAGTAMATVGDPEVRATPAGAAFMLLSCLGRAAKCVINTLLLQGSGLPGPREETLSKLTVLRYEAPMSGFFILVAAILLETHAVLSVRWTGTDIATYAGQHCANGLLMFLNQLSYLGVVEHTSPVASQVLMNVKMIFLVLASSALTPGHLGPVNAAGMVVAAGGAVSYAWVAAGRPKAEPKEV